MPEIANRASAFTIRELTGQQREVRLRGRALPYQPLQFSGSQRVEMTWYPGSPNATAQVLGPTEDETTVNGVWKDRFLKSSPQQGAGDANATIDGRAVRDVMELVKAVDSIRRQGQQVQVTWDEIVRFGFMTKLTTRWHRRQDVEWEIAFEWISQEGGVPQSTFATEAAASSMRAATADLLARLQNETRVNFAVVRRYGEPINAALNALELVSSELDALSDSSLRPTISPTETALRATSLTQTINVRTTELMQAATGLGPREARSDVPASVVPGQVIATMFFQRRLRRTARELRSRAVVTWRELVRRVESNVIARHTAREGEDLRDVSQRYYRTPHEWRRLMQFNRLDSPALEAGQVVLIPRLVQAGA